MIRQLIAILIVVIMLLANAPNWLLFVVGIPMLIIVLLWLIRFIADIYWFFKKGEQW
jgi:hypothetical protein